MTSAIWSWNPVYENVVEQVRRDVEKRLPSGMAWKPAWWISPPILPHGPQNVRDLTEAAKADIKTANSLSSRAPSKIRRR